MRYAGLEPYWYTSLSSWHTATLVETIVN